MDPIDFLAGHAPFSELSAAGRAELARGLEITWVRGGETVFTRQQTNLHLYAVRKGSVRLELDGQLVDHVGPGEIFGLTSVAGSDMPSFDALAESDCLLYRVHRDAVRALFRGEPAFASFFLQSLTSRLHALTDGSPVPLPSDLRGPVRELVDRPPVTLDVRATVADAARLMDRERVSSVLLVEGDGGAGRAPLGILTDRDLRGRVLAAGLGPAVPAREVMTSPVESVDGSLPVSEALLVMLRRGRHHLPVTERGAVIGVVTHSDLIRQHQHGPVALLKKIEKARDPDALAHYADDIAAMVETLDRSRVEPADVGRLVAALNDALVSRLLGLATRALGPPPGRYAWIVFGSEGRQEQSFLTDQDNALVHEEDSERAGRYFGALAERVVGDLTRVGFPPCAGGFMATRWCHPLEHWRRRFAGWIQQPEPVALLEASNFFDLRVVAGGLDLAPLEAAIRSGGESRLFLAHLARAALEFRPPIGLLHRIRDSPEGVDVKSGALMPIVGLARVYALEAGEPQGSTLKRLDAARRASVLSEESAGLLASAFRFAFALRLRTQLVARRSGAPIGNRVHLDALSPGERRHLKEAFLAVQKMQSATAALFGVDRLG